MNKKKIYTFILVNICILVIFNVKVFAFSGQGAGTPSDPYIVTNREQLDEVRNDLDAAYKLGNDIDLKNEEFDPIGYGNRDKGELYFKGIFDGDNFTISNYKFHDTAYSYKNGGIFESTDSALLKNIRILNADVRGGWYTGALVGYAYNNTEIINCSVTGEGRIVGNEDVGGLIGSTDGIIKNCYSTLDVKGSMSGGGLVGFSSNDVLNSYATGNVYSFVGGGLIGGGNFSRISECYASGNVVALFGGGLVGFITDVKIDNCFSVGNIRSHEFDEFEEVDGLYYMLVEILEESGLSPACGGLVGGTSIFDPDTTVDIQNCFSLGNVKSSFKYEGLVGSDGENVNVTNSYFSTDSTQIYSPANQARVPKQLHTKINYEGWDFDNIWSMEDGNSYPRLRNVGNTIKNLKCVNKTATMATLTWDKVAGASEYEIAYNDKVVKTLDSSIVLTDLIPNTLYNIEIRVLDGSGNESTSIILFQTDMLIIGQSPTNIVCTENNPDSIVLTWTAVPEATSYIVSYSDKALISDSNSITIDNLKSNTEYSFTIKAKNLHGESEPSLPIIIKTKKMSLNVVSGVAINKKTSNSVILSWNQVVGAESYEVKYNDTIIPSTGTSIIITNLEPKTQYAFKIRALSPDGESPWSNPLEITTLRENSKADDEYKLNATVGKTYDLAFSGDDISHLTESTFVVKYDATVLELVDFAAQTDKIDITKGMVPGTDLEIISISPGIVEFKLHKPLDENKAWSGVVTIIKFKALKTRNTTISFEQ